MSALTIPQGLAQRFQRRQELEIDPTTRAALASGEVRSFIYDAPGAPIELSLISGTDRSALHDPRSCLIGGGWKIEKDQPFIIPGTDVTARRCRIENNENSAAYDVIYLYVVDGQPIHQVTQIRARMLFGALVGKRNVPVYFIRCMRPVLPDAHNDSDVLGDFVSSLWPVLGLSDKKVN